MKFKIHSSESCSPKEVRTSMNVLTAPILSAKGRMAFEEFNAVFNIDVSKLQAETNQNELADVEINSSQMKNNDAENN